MIGEIISAIIIALIVSIFTFFGAIVPIIGVVDGDLGFVKFVYVTTFIKTPVSLYNKVHEKFTADNIDDLIEEKYTERQIKNTKIGMEDDLISKEEKNDSNELTFGKMKIKL